MSRYIIGTLITLCWLYLNFLLFKSEIITWHYTEKPVSYSSVIAGIKSPENADFDIYLRGTKIGYSKTQLIPITGGDNADFLEGGVLIKNQSEIRIKLPNLHQNILVSANAKTFISREGKLKTASAHFDLNRDKSVRLTVELDETDKSNKKFNISLDTGSNHEKFQVPYDDNLMFMPLLSPLMDMKYLSVGKAWEIAILNPFPQIGILGSNIQKIKAKVIAKEETEFNGKNIDVFRVEISTTMFQASALITPEGKLIKQEINPFGITLVRVK